MTRQIELVTWVDSCSPKGWTNKEVLENYTPDEITSVGWVIAETDGHLTIAAHEGNDQVDGVMCIPKVAILSRTVITIPVQTAQEQEGMATPPGYPWVYVPPAPHAAQAYDPTKGFGIAAGEAIPFWNAPPNNQPAQTVRCEAPPPGYGSWYDCDAGVWKSR